MSEPASYQSVLSIHGLTAEIHLGVGEEERSVRQRVVVDVRFYLPEPMESAGDDNGKYLCYYGISEKIASLCMAKPYRLIEFLTMEIYRLLRGLVPEPVKLQVTLRKPEVLLPYVTGGSSYRYSDLPPFSWVAPE